MLIVGSVGGKSLDQLRRNADVPCDLDFCATYQPTNFNFDLHRQPQTYGLITARKSETLATDGSLLG